MKILVITTFYPHPDRPDLLKDTSAVHYIAREWVKQGHQVTVLHCYGHYFRELIKEPGKHDFRRYETIQPCPDNEGVHVLLTENQFWIRNAKWYLPIQQKRISSAINHYFQEQEPGYQPDILLVHFPTNYIGIVDRLHFSCKKAAIFHKTDLEVLTQRPRIYPLLRQTYDALGTRTLQLQKKLARIGVNTTFIAHSGIDADLILTDQEFQAKWAVEQPTLRIVYAGNLVPDKKVDTVLTALSALKGHIPFRFEVIGDGRSMQSLIRLADTLGIADACHFTGRLSRAETIAAFRDADVFVMVSRPETLGLVYLEAMSQGCIAIGSRNEGIDGILVHAKNGYLVEPGDAAELRRCLEKLSRMSLAEKRAIAWAGLQTIREMTSQKTAAQYLEQALAASGQPV